MNKIPQLFLFIIPLFISFNAHVYALTPDIKLDILKVKLSEQLKKEDYTSAVKTINELKGLGVNLPASMDYFEGKALMGAGRPGEAYRKLESYVTREGKSGKYYAQAIKLMVKSDGRLNKEKQEKFKYLVSELNDELSGWGRYNKFRELYYDYGEDTCVLERKIDNTVTDRLDFSRSSFDVKKYNEDGKRNSLLGILLVDKEYNQPDWYDVRKTEVTLLSQTRQRYYDDDKVELWGIYRIVNEMNAVCKQ